METGVCVTVYCPTPKDLEHGKIMLIGIGGKFHYRPYVKQIGHNNKIEYVCDRDYLLIGPSMATCVHRQWSPRDERRCVLKKHPDTRLGYTAEDDRSAASSNTDASRDNAHH